MKVEHNDSPFITNLYVKVICIDCHTLEGACYTLRGAAEDVE